MLQKGRVLASYLVVIVVLLLSSLVAFQSPAMSQTEVKGPYIDEARFIVRDNENLALEEVRSGALDT